MATTKNARSSISSYRLLKCLSKTLIKKDLVKGALQYIFPIRHFQFSLLVKHANLPL